MTRAAGSGPAPDRRRRLAPEVRRRQVLDAAVAVFSEQGFHGTSMDAVAVRAGVSKPMVYAHGGTKEELFAACLAREGDRLLHSVTGAVAGAATAGPDVRLWCGLRAFFTAVTTRRAGWTVLYRQAAVGAFAADVARTRRRIVEGVAVLLAAGLGDAGSEALPVAHRAGTGDGGDGGGGHDDGDGGDGTGGDAVPAAVTALASTLVGAAEGLAEWWLDTAVTVTASDDDPADALARTVMSTIWPGLDALRHGRPWTPPIPTPATVPPPSY